jgi:hypothetical protein
VNQHGNSVINYRDTKTLCLCLLSMLVIGPAAAAAQSPAETSRPVTLIGCVSGGNLQPVEQPFVLEPSEPFVLVDVLTETSTFSPTNYRVTGINLAPWLGMRVRIQGTLTPAPTPAPATGTPANAKALPEIKATLVHSTWGTCPSPAAWIPQKGAVK